MIRQYCNLVVVDTEAEIPPVSGVSGERQFVIALDTGRRVHAQNGAWVDVAGTQGPQGDVGPKGDQGNPGINGTNGTNGIQCYTLPVIAANSATITDAQTIYFGSLAGLAPSATANLAPIYIPKAGSIKAAYIHCHAATAGTNEAWVLHIRVNNTTDTQIASLSANTATRLWSNTSLSVAVAQGDRVEIKSVNPTWVTNPANVRWGGVLYVEV